tara:strand:- start:1169 stop:1378 length:210 start_codon:yes stop_codon:yes gene_type:complete
MTIEKVSQEEMLASFKERLSVIVEENKQLAEKIKQNEITALKLQGAIEALDYYTQEEETASHPPDETEE